MQHDPGEPAGQAPPPAGEGFMEAVAGALFLAIGAAALWIGRNYPMGTAVNMGPGYLPQLVAWGLVLLGAAGIARGVLVGGWRPPSVMLRPLACISIAILVFAQTIDRLGIAIACAVTVAVAAAAQYAARWHEVPAIALGLAAFCALLFGYALNLSIPVWPR
jgi:hypothetical protein